MARFKIGEKIKWKWMGGKVKGFVREIHTSTIIREIKDKQIKRNGSEECPAYVVQSEAGNFALKLERELEPNIVKAKT